MPTVGQFAISRIKQRIAHGFGIPGDYCLNFYDQLSQEIDMVGTTDEQCAGFAADAYARVKGLGLVVVTYCVGGFKIINPIANAYAERSPVLVISGAPGVKERRGGLLLHHQAGPFESQLKMFEKITCAQAVLDDPTFAGREIDRVLESMAYHKRPGYIEIPRDIVDKNLKYDVYTQPVPDPAFLDKDNLEEAVEKSIEWIQKASNPVILAGVELARFDFGLPLIKFAERGNIPIATTLLGKSIVSERHPLSLGVYCGKSSREHVRKVVENSDCVLMLGVMQTDMNLGFKPFMCNQTNVIMANIGHVRIRRSTYDYVEFNHFMSALLSADVARKASIQIPEKAMPCFTPVAGKDITSTRLFEKIDAILDHEMAVIADVGDSLFGASDLTVHHRNHFLAPAYYTSMGNSVPGALGVQTALPKVRPIVVVGDGAFQMTGMEFSTLVRRKLNPIVIVLNNQGYSTERCLGHDGDFNNIQSWNYHMVPELVGGGKGFLVKTEDQLEEAFAAALANDNSASIINVVLDKMDVTPALKRMTDSLSEHV